LPISTVIKLAGRLAMPVPYGILRRVSALLWVAQLSEAPPPFAALMRHLCVVDCTRARRDLGFRPVYSTRDAVLDFEGALRLRSQKLLGHAT
jgi:UDP-glucose 4-epimerase